MQPILTASTGQARNGEFVKAAVAVAFVLGITWIGFLLGGMVILGALGAALVAILVFRAPVVGIMIYLITFLFTYPAMLRGVGNFTINNILGLMFVPLMLIGLLRDGRMWILRVKPLILIALTVVVLIGSAAYYAPSEEVRHHEEIERIQRSERRQGPALIETRGVAAKVMTRFAFLVFFVFFVRTPRDFKLVVGTIIACLLLSYAQITAQAGRFGWGTGRLRVLGEAGTGLYAGRNPNKLAYFALLCLTLLWYSRKAIKQRWLYVPWFAAAATTFWIIPLTGSRSGMLNLLVFLAIVLLEGRFSYRKIFGLAMVTAFIAVQFGYRVNVLDYVLPEQISARLTRFDATSAAFQEGYEAHGSVQGRQQTFQAGLRMIPRHPFFGVGIDNFDSERSIVDPSGTIGPPHNSYLWAVTEGGVVNFLLYALTFAMVFRSLRLIERNYSARFPGVELDWLVSALRTAMIGFLFFSLFADMWTHDLFYIFIGLCIAVIQLHETYLRTGKLPGWPMPALA